MPSADRKRQRYVPGFVGGVRVHMMEHSSRRIIDEMPEMDHGSGERAATLVLFCLAVALRTPSVLEGDSTNAVAIWVLISTLLIAINAGTAYFRPKR